VPNTFQLVHYAVSYPSFAHKTSTKTNATVSVPQAITLVAYTTPATRPSGRMLDWPSKALKAGVHGVPGGENTLAVSDGTVRYMTGREAARIQTFPDEWIFQGPWTEVFGHERMAAALLDQRIHPLMILLLEGESYRFRQSLQRQTETAIP
jgi:site-specific DNA-cytosine methylase